MADLDFELSGGWGGGGGLVLLTLPTFLPCVISSLLSKIRGGRVSPATGPSPRSATDNYTEMLTKCKERKIKQIKHDLKKYNKEKNNIKEL